MTVARKGIPDANGLSSGFGIVTIGADDSPAGSPIQLLAVNNDNLGYPLNPGSFTPDRNVFTTLALTAAQLIELPPASTVPEGFAILFADIAGGATSGNTISAKPSGTDTINGANSNTVMINAAYGSKQVFSNGVNGWMSK